MPRRLHPAAAIMMVDPKYGENVGGAIRACAAYGAEICGWSGTRVPLSKRVRRYGRLNAATEADEAVEHLHAPDAFELICARGFKPVAIELADDSVSLVDFEHHERAVYLFGPEDGTLSKAARNACVASVHIPTARCLNLAACVGTVLYDRAAKTLKSALRLPRSRRRSSACASGHRMISGRGLHRGPCH